MALMIIQAVRIKGKIPTSSVHGESFRLAAGSDGPHARKALLCGSLPLYLRMTGLVLGLCSNLQRAADAARIIRSVQRLKGGFPHPDGSLWAHSLSLKVDQLETRYSVCPTTCFANTVAALKQ